MNDFGLFIKTSNEAIPPFVIIH